MHTSQVSNIFSYDGDTWNPNATIELQDDMYRLQNESGRIEIKTVNELFGECKNFTFAR